MGRARSSNSRADGPRPASEGLTRPATDHLAREFQLAGFLRFPQLFSPKEVLDIRRHLQPYVTGQRVLSDDLVVRADHDPAQLVILAKLDQHDAFFAGLKQDRRLRDLAERLLGVELDPLHLDFINKQRGVPPTSPHQDAFIFTRRPSESVTCWLALDQIDDQNGCLCYARGSHWDGYRTHDLRPGPNRLLAFAERDRARETFVHVQPGDVVVHHSFTIHRSEPNRSNRSRWALAIPFIQANSTCIDKYSWIALQSHPTG